LRPEFRNELSLTRCAPGWVTRRGLPIYGRHRLGERRMTVDEVTETVADVSLLTERQGEAFVL